MGTCSAVCVSITFVSRPRIHPSKLSLGDAGAGTLQTLGPCRRTALRPYDSLMRQQGAPEGAGTAGGRRRPFPLSCSPQPHGPLMLIPFPAFPLAPEPASSHLEETCNCQQRLSSGASVLAPPASLSLRQKEEPPRLHPHPWGWRPLPVPRTMFLFTSPVLQYLSY